LPVGIPKGRQGGVQKKKTKPGKKGTEREYTGEVKRDKSKRGRQSSVLAKGGPSGGGGGKKKATNKQAATQEKNREGSQQ